VALRGKRVVITGGAGFIGSHLVERLVDSNEVIVYDNMHRNAIQFSCAVGHSNLRVVQGDILDVPTVCQAIRGAHIVIHCAAIAGVYSVIKNAITTMEVNLLGTHRVLQAALDGEVERFVHFSTSEVYGPFIHKGAEKDVNTIGPIGKTRWTYAASKLASEHLAFAYSKEHGLPLVIVRPFNIYGPRQIGEGAIREMILRALNRQPIVIYNDGTQIRSWCFIEDFVNGVLRCVERPQAAGEVFNLGNPQGTITNLELARMIKRLTYSESEIIFKEHPGPEVEVRVPSIEKASEVLGYRPSVSLEQGILRTIPWYQQHLTALEG
jgi:nucleoside-diphosphate-sugar epimerase